MLLCAAMFSQPDKLTVCPQAAHETATDLANMGGCPLCAHIHTQTLCMQTRTYTRRPIVSGIDPSAAQMYNPV